MYNVDVFFGGSIVPLNNLTEKNGDMQTAIKANADWYYANQGGLLSKYNGKFQDFDFLLGMDVISLGDFTITNKDVTRFTFRIPAEGTT